MVDEGGKDQLKPNGEGATKDVLELIGDVVIGKVDPRTLSREEFEESPDLLFHGAASDFEFERQLVSGSNSATIGLGFYTTDDLVNAEEYSRIRLNYKGNPTIIKILPYQARMLDQRSSNNHRINTPVSIDFARDYRDFVVARIKSLYPDGRPSLESDQQGALFYQDLSNYRNVLNRLIFSGEPIQLRQLLSIFGTERDSEFGAEYFTDFMLEKGYDGLIYNEGGDSPSQKHTTSFVFYNPDKIGTFEAWHQGESVKLG